MAVFLGFLFTMFLPFCILVALVGVRIVNQYEQGVILTLGKYADSILTKLIFQGA